MAHDKNEPITSTIHVITIISLFCSDVTCYPHPQGAQTTASELLRAHDNLKSIGVQETLGKTEGLPLCLCNPILWLTAAMKSDYLLQFNYYQ